MELLPREDAKGGSARTGAIVPKARFVRQNMQAAKRAQPLVLRSDN